MTNMLFTKEYLGNQL